MLIISSSIIKSKQIIYIPDSITKSFGYTQVVAHQSLRVGVAIHNEIETGWPTEGHNPFP